jgi:uncharacterized membrane protein (DUF485 family)
MSSSSHQVWSRIGQSPRYQQLLKSKRAFIFPASVFFIVYYFALPVLVGWFPELMKTPVLGPVNVAYLFALSQFFMAWLIAFIYVRKAGEWDKQAHLIIEAEGADVHP